MEYGRWTVNALPQRAGQGELKLGSVKMMSQGCSRERGDPGAIVIIAGELGLR